MTINVYKKQQSKQTKTSFELRITIETPRASDKIQILRLIKIKFIWVFS